MFTLHKKIQELVLRGVSKEWIAALEGITSPNKRLIVSTFFWAATAQRIQASKDLHRWSAATHFRQIELDVFVLACSRDVVLLCRMIHSLITNVGLPSSITVISDGSLTDHHNHCIKNIWSEIEVLSFESVIDPNLANSHPELIKLCNSFPLAKKIPLMMAPLSSSRPKLVLDPDIEFFKRGGEFAKLLESTTSDEARYMLGDSIPLDLRLVDNKPVIAGFNSGFCLFFKDLSWTRTLSGIEVALTSDSWVREQTMVAAAFTDSPSRHLDPNDYFLGWRDAGNPRDIARRSGAVLRHYASPAVVWKMYLRGGPRNISTLPIAAFSHLLTTYGRCARSTKER